MQIMESFFEMKVFEFAKYSNAFVVVYIADTILFSKVMASDSTNDKALQFPPPSKKEDTESEDEDDDFHLPSFLLKIDSQQASSSNSGRENFLLNRHKTSPNILSTLTEPSCDDDNQRFVSSINLPAKSSPRKSFLGDLFNRFTFKKKPDHEQINNENQDGLSEKSTIKNDSAGSHVRGRRKADFFGNKNASAGDQNKEVQDQPAKMQKTTNTVNTLQMSIKKWKLMKATEQKRETIALNEDHQKVLDEAIERFQTEVPHPLQMVIKEEAVRVVTKTMGMYRSMLGGKHELTKEAMHHIAQMKLSLYGPSQ